MKKRNGMSEKEASNIASEMRREEKRQRVIEYNKQPKKCKMCDSPIDYERRRNKYCGHSCAATCNNQGKQRNISTLNKFFYQGRWYRSKCKNCGKPNMNKFFCSTECGTAFGRTKRRADIIRTGKLITGKRDRWFLEETREKGCESCGNDEWMGRPIPIDIHHEDGDSDNDDLNNIKLLCPNCHRLTNNHGSKNKNGRRSRRKKYRNARYKNGESY